MISPQIPVVGLVEPTRLIAPWRHRLAWAPVGAGPLATGVAAVGRPPARARAAGIPSVVRLTTRLLSAGLTTRLLSAGLSARRLVAGMSSVARLAAGLAPVRSAPIARRAAIVPWVASFALAAACPLAPGGVADVPRVRGAPWVAVEGIAAYPPTAVGAGARLSRRCGGAPSAFIVPSRGLPELTGH